MPAQGAKIYLKVCRLWKDRVTYMKRKIYIHCMALAVIAILETLLLTLGVSYDMLKKQIMEDLAVRKAVDFVVSEAVEK